MTQAIERAPNGTTLAARDETSIIEQVIAKGDLAQLKPEERVSYYRAVCHSLGLNELTQPFQYIPLNGKLTLYAGKGCTDQLRELRNVNITKIEREQIGDLFVVTAYAQRGSRTDSEIGAVNVAGLRGEALANAMMKAITKAKRRVTLSICGLGMLDESEVESIPGTQTVVVDNATGQIQQPYVATDIRDVDDQPQIQRRPSSMITSADEQMWQRWLDLKSEAEGLGVVVSEIRLPIGRQLLQSEGLKVREALSARLRQLAQDDAERAQGAAEHQTRAAQSSPLAQAQPGRAASDTQSEAAPPEGDRPITDKREPLWQEWLGLERQARQVPDLGIDTSVVKLPTTEGSLRASIDTLREAIDAAPRQAEFEA